MYDTLVSIYTVDYGQFQPPHTIAFVIKSSSARYDDWWAFVCVVMFGRLRVYLTPNKGESSIVDEEKDGWTVFQVSL